MTTPIAVLGGGNLGSAILAGLAAAGVPDLRATTRSRTSAARFDGTAVVATSVEAEPEANRAAVSGAGVVISGVKPAGTADLLREIAPALDPGAVVVSLAVGTPLTVLEDVLPDAAIVRAMPNTPVRVRSGVTGLARGSAVGEQQFTAVVRLFEVLGEVVVLDDARIDLLAAVSGSGPAYVYLLLERFADAATGLGFDRADADRIVARTFAGALALQADGGGSPAELRRAVTSPNGTTAAAIQVFDERDLSGLFGAALAAAVARAEELSARDSAPTRDV